MSAANSFLHIPYLLSERVASDFGLISVNCDFLGKQTPYFQDVDSDDPSHSLPTAHSILSHACWNQLVWCTHAPILALSKPPPPPIRQEHVWSLVEFFCYYIAPPESLFERPSVTALVRRDSPRGGARDPPPPGQASHPESLLWARKSPLTNTRAGYPNRTRLHSGFAATLGPARRHTPSRNRQVETDPPPPPLCSQVFRVVLARLSSLAPGTPSQAVALRISTWQAHGPTLRLGKDRPVQRNGV